jgi:adenine phosphoribosyltransferase
MNLAVQSLTPPSTADLESYIRTIPDFPKPGINFKDIMPLLAAPAPFQELVDRLSREVRLSGAEKIVGLESRGFLVGIAVAQNLSLPFVAARKAGKLPGDVVAHSYALEYGNATIEMQRDAIKPGEKVAILDDLLATGGTAKAAGTLVEKLGGNVSGYFFAIELKELPGREQLDGKKVSAVLSL